MFRNSITYQTLILMLLLLTVFEVTVAQDNSLLRKTRMPRSHMYVPSMLDSAIAILNTDQDRSFKLIEEALQYSIKNKDLINESRCYMALGEINILLGQYDLADDYLNKALFVLPRNITEQKVVVQNKLAKSQKLQRNYSTSNTILDEALSNAETLNQRDNLVNIRYEIASNFNKMGEHEKALKTYKEILEIEKARNNTKGIAIVNNAIGETYLKINNTQLAEQYYQNSITQAQQLNNREIQSNALRGLGNVYKQENKQDKELEVREQSLSLNKEDQNFEEVYEDNIAIGDIYLQKNMASEAESYYQKGVELSNIVSNKEKKQRAYKKLSDVYIEKKEYDKALLAYQDYVSVVDSIHAEKQKKLEDELQMVATANRNLQRIDMLEKDYNLNKKNIYLMQKEQDIQQKELKVQQRLIIILLLSLLVVTVSGVFILRSSILKRKANMLLALKSLRSQMNPHFIFNSLNSINNYISQNNERLANRYLTDFSLLMRNVLENSKHDFVNLKTELDLIKLYIKLEHERFQEKFTYEIKIDNESQINQIMVPPMLIQPYIENAIWHGLRYKEDKGELNFSIYNEEHQLRVKISDNGIGRKKSLELKTKHQKSSTSTGLKNTQNRLNILNSIYKTNYGVTISDLNPEDKTGTLVEIVIPKQKHCEEVA